uniref:NADH-ubiquinone oxidoreductase chain 5 n=1 Tax=Pedinomonas minor TaxID=3159 RepID=Q9ZY28_PEDMN|nr:NADH dehydrogenase subunit 5 [Pedinomonas minor]AAD19666.1 NADH dehydrogenase subunit 5 [Pedinomonas minor]
MYLIILLFPLISLFVISINLNFLGIRGFLYLSTFSLAVSLLLAHVILYDVLILGIFTTVDLGEWIYFYELGSYFTFTFDVVSSIFIYVVLFISFLVHSYSIFYISQDPYSSRFILYLNLFTWFILVLVVSENALTLFLGWEGIGITSYLLINFWYSKLQSGKSAIKAVFLNRIGDSFFLIALGLTFYLFGSDDLFLISSLSVFYEKQIVKYLIIAYLIASIAKSAQILLHVWLPDAIEAPTPVSSLLHAATLVGAGVYLLIKLSFLSLLDFDSSNFIIVIGILTSFLAGLIGFNQFDTKRIIAYSTCSQIGLMFYAIGLISLDFSYLHFVIHGVFKCLMFLLAGAFIHTIFNEQDIRKYGSLNFLNSFLSLAFVLSNLSLLGIFFIAGFYSKELLLISGIYYNNFWSLLSVLAIFTTCLYGIKSILLVLSGSPNWNSFFSITIYDTNLIVIIILSVLVILNTFFGPMITEQIKLMDIVYNKSVFFSIKSNLFLFEHVYVNWIILFVISVFLILSWNYSIFFFSEKSLSFINLKKIPMLFFYNRGGFDAIYQIISYKIFDFSYRVNWLANDKGYLPLFIFYFPKSVFSVVTNFNLIMQHGLISIYYISIFSGLLFFILFI